MKKKFNCDIHTQWNTTQQQKEKSLLVPTAMYENITDTMLTEKARHKTTHAAVLNLHEVLEKAELW